MSEADDVTPLVADLKLGDALECITAFNEALRKHGKQCVFRIGEYEFSHARLPDGPNNRRDLLLNVAMMYGGPIVKDRMNLYGEGTGPLFEMTVQQLGEVGFGTVMQNLSAVLMDQAFDRLAEMRDMNLSPLGIEQCGHIWRDVFDKTTDNLLGRRFLTPERSQLMLDIAANLAPHNEWVASNQTWIAERLQSLTPGAPEARRPKVAQSGTPASIPGGPAGGQTG